MRSWLVIALLLATTYCQDAFDVPTDLLADINPGPDSSDPSPLQLIKSAGKAYASVTITGKIFPQLVVTDGSYEGTKLLAEFTTENRGDPYKDDPFWDGGYSELKDFVVFDDKLWFMMYNYESKSYGLWIVDPVDDIPRRNSETIFVSTDDGYPNVKQAFAFKNNYFLFTPSLGLCKLTQGFSQCVDYNDSSAFDLSGLSGPAAEFDGFTYPDLKLKSDNLMLFIGNAFGYSGLWTFDGSTFKPINLEASTYAEFAYNQNKYYYSAHWLGWEQLFVYEPSSNKNFTVLTDLTQSCLECFSDLTPMADGRIAFEYNSQVGTSDGTIAGTSLLTGKPRIANIIGTFENRVYCSDFYTEHLLSTDGTPGGTKNLTNAVVRRILTFNGNAFFGATRPGYEGDFWRISAGKVEPELIREDVLVMNEWIQVTLPNGNMQQYLYYYVSGSNRGTRYYDFWLYVTNGNGIVRFTDDLNTPMPPPVFLKNRFIMPGSNAGVGKELFYMDLAPESYETPVGPASTSSTEPQITGSLAFNLVAFGIFLGILI